MNLQIKLIEKIKKENPNRKNTFYPDYPVSPFGPTRLISKETIKELVKRN